MFFIIWGRQRRQITVGKREFHCPSCNSWVRCDLKESRPYFSLFFIPMLPLGAPERYVECRICDGKFPPAALTGPKPNDKENLDAKGPGEKASKSWPKSNAMQNIPIGCWLVLAFGVTPVLCCGGMMALAAFLGPTENNHANLPDGPKRIKSNTGLIEVTVPQYWKETEMHGKGNELDLADDGKRSFFTATIQPRNQLAPNTTCKEVAKRLAEEVEKGDETRWIISVKMRDGHELKIDGHPAFQHTLDGTAREAKSGVRSVDYFVTVIEGKQNFYAIKARASAGGESRTQLKAMVESVRIMEPDNEK